MANTVRMNITVESDIPELLAQLAGSKRDMGSFVTQLLRDVAAGNYITVDEHQSAVALAVRDGDERVAEVKRQAGDMRQELQDIDARNKEIVAAMRAAGLMK